MVKSGGAFPPGHPTTRLSLDLLREAVAAGPAVRRLLDVGCGAGVLSLAAAALGLGSCPIAALYDDEINALVGVDGRAESAVYMTSVGRIA